MTLRKRIIISIGALIIFTSLTIIIVAGNSLYRTGISHAYNILEINNDSLYTDVKSKLSELRNYSITSIFNKMNSLNNPTTQGPGFINLRYVNSFTIYNKKGTIISFPQESKHPTCIQAQNISTEKDQILFSQARDSSYSICVSLPIYVHNEKYEAVFNLAPIFFNRRAVSLPTLIIVPDHFELQLQNYTLSKYKDGTYKKFIDDPATIKGRSNFIRAEKHVILFQEVPDTNLRIMSYSAEDKINSAYKNFLYSSLGIMLLILFTSILIFFFVVNSFLKPIKNLCTASKCFADGIYNSKLDLTKFGEINELIYSFNSMIKKIKQREDELYLLNKNLEQEVNKKTSELLHAAKMASLGTLSSGIAHEFNNILGALIGHVSLALEKKDPKEMEEALQIALMASERACDIVSRLQDFAKKRAENHVLFNVNEAINNTIKLIEHDLVSCKIKIDKKLTVKAIVKGNQSQIEQVILNLLINSKHAMPSGGTVTVFTSISDGKITITIKDTGAGIDPQVKDRIFEPFFTTKGVVGMGKSFGSQDADGLGLGLSVSLGIIEDHNGSIHLIETSQEGTVFEIILPLAD